MDASLDREIFYCLDQIEQTDKPDYWILRIRGVLSSRGETLENAGITEADLAALREKAFTRIINSLLEGLRSVEGINTLSPELADRRIHDQLGAGGLKLENFGLTEESYQKVLKNAYRLWLPYIINIVRRDYAEGDQSMLNGSLAWLRSTMERAGIATLAEADLPEGERLWLQQLLTPAPV